MRDIRISQLPATNFFNKAFDRTIIRSIILPILLLAGTLILWLVSIPKIDPAKMNDLGLISVLPLTFIAALGVLAISFILALNQEKSHDSILLLHVLVLIFILHATPQIVYGTLRYSWAWKHVGIVDYIQRHGSVDPTLTNLNAYHNWPGFFALAAFYNVIAGLPSSLVYAGWGPLFFNLIDLGALWMIYKSLTQDRRLMWFSLWLFFLFSWVGQDYFSPQAISYFMYLIAIAIVLKWFRERSISSREDPKPKMYFQRIRNFYHRLIARAAVDVSQGKPLNSRQRLAMMAMMILVFTAIASSHQLTPLILISALAALVIFQITNQRYLPVLMVVITTVWIIFMAIGFLNGNLSWIVKSIGSLLDNVNGNLVNLDIASPGQQLIARIDRLLSAAVWILGFLGLIRRYRSGHWDLAAILLTIAPIPMLVLNSYGGEMLFRVYLFSLPFITFLAAALFYPHLQAGLSLKTPLFTAILSLMLIPGFLYSYYGKEEMYYFSPNEIAAAQYLFNIAPKGSLIVDGIWDWPRQYTNYEYYNYFSIFVQSQVEKNRVLQNPIGTLSNIMEDATPGSVYVTQTHVAGQTENESSTASSTDQDEYPAAFLIITRSQIAEAEMTGALPANFFSTLTNTLPRSPHFQVIYSNPDATIIEYIH
jgi:hypothetical protein